MAGWTREFHRSKSGRVLNNEEWWRLVFDGKEIFVEHEWDSLDVRSSLNESDTRKDRIEVNQFLGGRGHGDATTALVAVLDLMAPRPADA